MKRIFKNLMLGALLLTTSAQVTHAGISQTAKSAAQYLLKKVGNNPGWVAYAAIIPCVYMFVAEQENPGSSEEKAAIWYRTLRACLPIGLGAVAISAACNWWASKL